jgi:hypothetical protein
MRTSFKSSKSLKSLRSRQALEARAAHREAWESLEERRLMAAPDVIIDRPPVALETIDDQTAIGVPLRWQISTNATAAHLTVTLTPPGGTNQTIADFDLATPRGLGTFDYHGFGLGHYFATLTASNADGSKTALNDFTVIDDDTSPPTVAFDEPRIDPQTDAVARDITWGYSADVSSATLTVTRDGATIFNGPAPASRSFDYGNEIGTYVATLTVFDNDNDRPDDAMSATATKTVHVVDDDTTPPGAAFNEPTSPTQTDESRTPFEWLYSPDVSVAKLKVTRDGVTIFDGDAPASGTYAYGPELGVYTATLTVTDDDNDRPGDSLSFSTSRTVTVVDDDTTPPAAAFNEPSSPTQTDETRTPFEWLNSPDVSRATLVVTRDGTEIFNGPAPASGTFSYGPELGVYTATLTVTDDDNDRPGDSLSFSTSKSVTVVDDDTTAPTVAFDEPRLATLLDSSTGPLTWGYAADVGTARLTVSRNGTVLFDGPAPAGGEYNYGNELGNYTATLTVTDNDNDRAGDSLSASTSKSWTVVDDDVTAPTILITNVPAGLQVTDTQPRRFEWGTTDDQTDVPLVTVRVTRQTTSGPVVIYEDLNAPTGGRFDLTPFGLGTFTMTVTSTDKDNDRPDDSLTATSSKTIQVVTAPAPEPEPTPTPAPSTAVVQDDPTAPGKKMLVVTGTQDCDYILVSRSLVVKINGQNKGSFGSSGVSRVVVNALGGNDFVWMADSYTGCGDSDSCVFGRVNLPTFVYGGAGNDLLVTGNGGGVVVGGDGNDLIVGGAGRDVTIGGKGCDAIGGLANDDILVAGYTSIDNNDASLVSVHKEWSRTDRAYLDRIRALKGEISGLNGSVTLRTDGTAQNVFDDGAADQVDLLIGGDGNDWFLFNTGEDGGAKDIVLGSTGTEVKSDIDAT